ncbi:hypothetical protein [Pseudonocardia sp. TMWB2A]|uniref:hypothetical protein n=1 Tax=Pseudonocardia sp. TMWB2A TaxID=687430 RepID=UPI00307CE2D1
MSSSHRPDDNSLNVTRRNDDNPRTPASCHVDEEQFAEVGARVARELGPVAMPDDVAARMRARLAAEVARAAPGPERGGTPAADGPPPGRRTPWRALALAAAALVVAGIGVAALVPTAPVVVPVAGTAPEELRSAAAGADVPVGALDDPARVRACLSAAGDPRPDAPFLTARPHSVDGRPAVLLVLGGPERGRYRLVVVPPDCGPGTARVLAETTTG